MIEHGVPEHEYFAIVLPQGIIKPTIDALEPDYVKPVHTFLDPNTKKTYEAEVHEVASWTIAEFISMSIPSIVAYGIPAKIMALHLQKRYPQIRKQQALNYIVLKKL
jgi:hypothetical protein